MFSSLAAPLPYVVQYVVYAGPDNAEFYVWGMGGGVGGEQDPQSRVEVAQPGGGGSAGLRVIFMFDVDLKRVRTYYCAV